MAEDVRVGALRPGKIVEDGDTVDRRTDAHQVAQRLFDAGGGSEVGIAVGIARIEAAGDDDAGVAAGHRRDDGGVGRTIVGDAHQRLHDRSGLHFMVVLADHRFLAGDVRPRQQAA